MSFESWRVLIWLKPRFIGDAVMATCLVDALRGVVGERFLRASPPIREIYADRAPGLEFVEAANIKRPTVLLRHARELRRLGFDVAVLVDRSFRAALAARLAGIPVRIGHSTEGRSFLLTHSLPYDNKKFEAECYLDLLEPLGARRPEARPSVAVSAGERAAGARLVGECVVGVNPGGRHNFKHLPYRTTAQVARRLQERGFKVALLGGKQDREHAEALVRLGLSPHADLVGKTSIREALGALANLRLVFGSDSGLMHLAAAVGTPTVTAFGKEPASKWGYLYEPHAPIQAPRGRLDRVSADSVFEACLRALGEA